jgi:hypothetical protein
MDVYVQMYIREATASVVYWSKFLAADSQVPGSISGVTRFSEM